MRAIRTLILIFFLTFTLFVAWGQFPDQQYVISGVDSLEKYIETKTNIKFDYASNSIVLEDDATDGQFILQPFSFEESFNEGLPSWNGLAPEDENSAFKVQMRFETSRGWSDWVTVGYWDKHIWSWYGDTEFQGGKVNIDVVKLNEYINNYQFKVQLKRNSLSYQSPGIEQLSFFVSDSKTTDNVDISDIVADNPPKIFIKTDFIYQITVDDEIGSLICSPTSTSMIIRSYDIEVDPYDFALRTYDPEWELFGVWPRAVQHAHEYGLQGSVTRYRTWSEAYEVLNNGGRIAMSVGRPLYAGHLMMLAGFDSNGNPIVHDPAKSSGYGKIYYKKDLTESWFNKGGISYTFYPKESPTAVAGNELSRINNISVYPNPVADRINMELNFQKNEKLSVRIFDLNGRCIDVLCNETVLPKGNHVMTFKINQKKYTPGIYLLHVVTGSKHYKEKIVKQ
ncbi:MAG: C39 family peptidase [Bacteroidota bacterium]